MWTEETSDRKGLSDVALKVLKQKYCLTSLCCCVGRSNGVFFLLCNLCVLVWLCSHNKILQNAGVKQ